MQNVNYVLGFVLFTLNTGNTIGSSIKFPIAQAVEMSVHRD